MLTSLQIKNFKAWKDTGKIRLAPLTVIFGANSAGKSSLGHLLLALKQTAASTDRKRSLHLGDDKSLIDLGTFKECIYNHDLKNTLSFNIEWESPEELEVSDPLKNAKNKSFKGNKLSLDVDIKSNISEQPEVNRIKYSLETDKKPFDVLYQKNKDDKYDLESPSGGYNFVRTHGRVWPLDEPEKFYRIPESSRAKYKNADFLSDFALSTEDMLKSLYYIGPLRDKPERTYMWSGDSYEDVGHKGEKAIPAILSAKNQNRRISLKENDKRPKVFDAFIAQCLVQMKVISEFKVEAKGEREYEVKVKTHPTASEVKITDVGFGVSQVLPVLVQSFCCPPNSVVWMEQPEIHLHPQVQTELADVFISAIQAREGNKPRNTQLIIESHSEHLLNRLQRRIAEGNLNGVKITKEDVAIYFCKRGDDGVAELEELELNLYGDIINWPKDFFGNEMEEIAERTKAAMKTRMKA